MAKIFKIIWFGFLTWLIPFIVSFFFVDNTGNYLIPETFFKTIMIVTGGLVGTFLMAKYFIKIKGDYLKEGVIIGLSWLAINLCIDLIFVGSGFFKMSFLNYLTDIGLRYLIIPIYSIGIGYVLEKKK
ncbi:MAG: hypothetical protein WCX30_03550 [Candidatus Paceibacterota bacterium]|jgi:hypothetical protein|nr:hypothetical protein [bacterium]